MSNNYALRGTLPRRHIACSSAVWHNTSIRSRQLHVPPLRPIDQCGLSPHHADTRCPRLTDDVVGEQFVDGAQGQAGDQARRVIVPDHVQERSCRERVTGETPAEVDYRWDRKVLQCSRSMIGETMHARLVRLKKKHLKKLRATPWFIPCECSHKGWM